MNQKCHLDPKLRKEIRIIDGLIALLLIIVAVYSIVNYNQAKEEITEGVVLYGLIGLGAITIFLELVPQLINPIFAVWAAILAGFNVHIVIIVAILASLAGSIFGFWLGKKFGQKYVCALFEAKTIEKINRFWTKHGRAFVVISAVTPLPYFPLIFGSLNMSWKDFAIYGLIFRVFNFLIFGYLLQFGILGILQ